MKKAHLVISLFFIYEILLLYTGTEQLGAEPVTGNNKGAGVISPDRHPSIFFENPDFDFGQIYKGHKVEHVFMFENRGDDILQIKKVKSSCGCTAAILTNGTIPPGEKGEIKATFSAGSYSGNIKKSITVSSNDPNAAESVLTISGEIIEDIIIRPKNINFGSIYIDEKADKTVSIRSETVPDLKIKKITPSKPFIDASVTGEKDGEYVVRVALIDNPGIGRFSGGIYLETNNPKQKDVNIPFFGEIVGDITTYPTRIYYGIVTRGKELSQKLFVKINKSNARILEVKISPDYVSTSITESFESDNPHYLIEVSLSPEAVIGKIEGVLELHTNSEIQPVIRIPVTGEIKEG